MEPLNKFGGSATQGRFKFLTEPAFPTSMWVRCVAIFCDCKSLKMEETENRIFRFPWSDKSGMDLFKPFLVKV